VEKINKHTKKNYAPSWLYLQDGGFFPLTLSPLALYIYGAPSKGRKSNVVYIFGNAESRIYLLPAQCCNTE